MSEPVVNSLSYDSRDLESEEQSVSLSDFSSSLANVDQMVCRRATYSLFSRKFIEPTATNTILRAVERNVVVFVWDSDRFRKIFDSATASRRDTWSKSWSFYTRQCR